MFNLGWLEVALIVLVAVLIFGPKKIPELGGALAKSLRGFQNELKKTTDSPDDEDQQSDEGI
ncbi:Sec-independent protein translocase subunit TatA/TatB [Prochlorothrix hollandica]|uniref:Sec-independent protein translocase protein TatA n=1 Tax=Prochlorothrix hollandica PCC 9006 = CALU 1027 TaxID=317619 RepID=A0A0M2PV59_PROHO|nr:twin-arginine translocase TatA/TatE family subunit [Prochlorothrix hollandica]KKI98548.1 prohead protease [Prochlorothrix hollandica PCC 9006 = CALU 1027]